MAEINRVAITFCFKACLSTKETLVLVQKAYWNESVKSSKVFRWYSRFRDEKEVVEDMYRGADKSLVRPVRKERS